MTYARPQKPRFFTDNVNAMKINGYAKTDIIGDEAGTFNTGYDEFDLFDLNPLNVGSWNTSGNTGTHIVISVDLGDSGFTTDYFACLNHNLNTAEGGIRIAYSGTPISAAGSGNSVVLDTQYLNATESGTPNQIEPSADGDTVFSFTARTERYWIIEIYDLTAFSGTDLEIGSFILGEMYSLPNAPDLNVTHDFSVDGVQISESIGGKRFSNPDWIKANNNSGTNYIPFRRDIGAQQLPGRERFSLSYSFISDDDLLPSNLGAPTGDNFATDVLAKTGWHTLPFIFTIDDTSTTQGDYMFARFMSNSFSITQVAWRVYNMAFSVEQEF